MAKSERSLLTVLFIDIVGSTERAAELGDRDWGLLLHRFQAVVEQEARYRRGEIAGTSGDEVVVLFEGPARALLAGSAIRDKVHELGLEVRMGLHMGKIERVGRGIEGIGVHIGARVAALAGQGEILVSSTLHDAETGSGFGFEDRGVHTLKGVPGEWRLYAVTAIPDAVEPEADPSRRRLRPNTRPIAVGGVFLAVALVAGLFLIRDRIPLTPEEAAAEAAGPGIAVLPFAVNDPELERWREGLVDLFSSSLDGAGGLRAIDSRTVLARWGDRVGEGETADLGTALEVARQSGAVYGLVGSAVSSGTDLVLIADVYDLATSAMLGQRRVEGSPDSIFRLVDRLSIDVLDLLLEEDERASTKIDLASITTQSVDALKSYLRGEAALRRSDFEAAILGYEEAVASDSTFALAWFRLSDALGWMEIAEKPLTQDALQRAHRFAGRLSDRERSLLEVSAAYHTPNPNGTELGRRTTQRYPDDPQAWYLLGEVLFHQPFQSLAERREIDQAFTRALRLDPSYTPAYIHPLDLAFQYADSARILELLEGFERSASATGYGRGYRLAYQLAYGTPGERQATLAELETLPVRTSIQVAQSLKNPLFDDAAEELYARVLRSPRRVQVASHPSAFMGLIAIGRLRQAIGLLQDDGMHPDLRAWNLVLLRNMDLPIDEGFLRRAAALSPGDSIFGSARGGRLLLGALLAIENGRWSDAVAHRRGALQLVEQAKTSADSMIAGQIGIGFKALEGRAAMLAGQDERARKLFDESFAGGLDLALPWVMEVLERSGRPEEALRYGRVAGPKAWLGVPMGRLYAEIGDNERALEAYGWVTHAWEDGDPELQPWVLEARQAVARLRGLQRG